jgi:hypothetical protein
MTVAVRRMTNPKSEYTEYEVAQELGVSVEQLRIVIRERILADDEVREVPVSVFQPSDLVLLRLLTMRSAAEAPQG